jgi:hypothetical protein
LGIRIPDPDLGARKLGNLVTGILKKKLPLKRYKIALLVEKKFDE